MSWKDRGRIVGGSWEDHERIVKGFLETRYFMNLVNGSIIFNNQLLVHIFCANISTFYSMKMN